MPLTHTLDSSEIKAAAAALGFTFCGIVRAEPSPTLDAYLRWIEAEMHGTMGYMARPDRVARRRDLRVIIPDAASMLVVGYDYRTGAVSRDVLTDPMRGRIAAYAWGADYHDVMGARLNRLVEQVGGRVYVDTGAILERSHAQQGGLGFVGKNTMLIHPQHGSMFFIGEIITPALFDHYDTPLSPSPSCGSCTRCLRACPTNAFPAPHVLDARRCISALTIEHKGSIPPDLRPNFGNWVYGCDVCQDVCPFQRFAPITAEPTFFPMNIDRAAPPLTTLLALDDAAFKTLFAGSAIPRIGRARMVRNACIAAGNSGDRALLPHLESLTRDPDALVSEHAAWGVARLLGDV